MAVTCVVFEYTHQMRKLDHLLLVLNVLVFSDQCLADHQALKYDSLLSGGVFGIKREDNIDRTVLLLRNKLFFGNDRAAVRLPEDPVSFAVHQCSDQFVTKSRHQISVCDSICKGYL